MNYVVCDFKKDFFIFCDKALLSWQHLIKSQRVLRWPLLLLEVFDYTFKYTPGKDNKVADMLSRFPIIPVHQHQIISMAAVDNNNC